MNLPSGDAFPQNGPLTDVPTETSSTTMGGGPTETEPEEDRVGALDFQRPQKTSTSMAPRLPSNMNADLFFGDGELGKIVFDEFEALRL